MSSKKVELSLFGITNGLTKKNPAFAGMRERIYRLLFLFDFKQLLILENFLSSNNNINCCLISTPFRRKWESVCKNQYFLIFH
jgi:hypothetical protein